MSQNSATQNPVDPEINEHSPHKATIYSAILPGLGQAYNKKYYKIPLIYIGFGVIGYFIDWNNDKYTFSKQAYNDLVDDDETTNSFLDLKNIEYFNLNNPASVSTLKNGLIKSQDYYRRNRDLLIISFAGFYALNIIDASVDAHLFNFDVSDDLTIEWQPFIDSFDNQKIFCLHCTMNF